MGRGLRIPQFRHSMLPEKVNVLDFAVFPNLSATHLHAMVVSGKRKN